MCDVGPRAHLGTRKEAKQTHSPASGGSRSRGGCGAKPTPAAQQAPQNPDVCFGEPPGFPGPGIPGQGRGTGRALGSQPLPMQVVGKLVPGRQGSSGGQVGLSPGGTRLQDRRGTAFIQMPQFAVVGLGKPGTANRPGSSVLHEGETEAGQAMGASGRRQGQPAQPRPCRDPLALQKDDPSASTLLCPTVGRQPSTEHHAHPVLPSPAQPPSTGSTSVSTCPTSARASSYH